MNNNRPAVTKTGPTILNVSLFSHNTDPSLILLTVAPEELELSSQLTNGTMTNLVSGCLHPNWKPLVKKDSEGSDASSRLLECSLTSTSTLMTL
jgi:hypothetical protein